MRLMSWKSSTLPLAARDHLSYTIQTPTIVDYKYPSLIKILSISVIMTILSHDLYCIEIILSRIHNVVDKRANAC